MNENQIIDLLMDLTEKVNNLTRNADILAVGLQRLESDVTQLKNDISQLKIDVAEQRRDLNKIVGDNQLIKSYLFKADGELNDHHRRLKDLERKIA